MTLQPDPLLPYAAQNRAGDPSGRLAADRSLSPEQLLAALHASRSGLQSADAAKRLQQYGPNKIQAQQQSTAVRLLLSQFKSPLVLILVFAAIISASPGNGPMR